MSFSAANCSMYELRFEQSSSWYGKTVYFSLRKFRQFVQNQVVSLEMSFINYGEIGFEMLPIIPNVSELIAAGEIINYCCITDIRSTIYKKNLINSMEGIRKTLIKYNFVFQKSTNIYKAHKSYDNIDQSYLGGSESDY